MVSDKMSKKLYRSRSKERDFFLGAGTGVIRNKN
jgi:hypothetical protein